MGGPGNEAAVGGLGTRLQWGAWERGCSGGPGNEAAVGPGNKWSNYHFSLAPMQVLFLFQCMENKKEPSTMMMMPLPPPLVSIQHPGYQHCFPTFGTMTGNFSL